MFTVDRKLVVAVMGTEFLVDKLDKFFPVGIVFEVDSMDMELEGDIAVEVGMIAGGKLEDMMDILDIVVVEKLLDI